MVSGRGDHIGDTKIDGGEDTVSSVSVTAVLVPAKRAQRVVIAFGDSLVDGDASSIDQNRNWPSALSRRLRASESLSTVAVANEGIAGNRLLRDGPVPSLGAGALARLDRDALSLPGATHIILLEGVNDLGFPGAKLGGLSLADAADARSASDLIGAYRQIIARAHAHGIKVIGCTLMPFEGVTVPGYYSDAKEAVRERVNRWIRSSAAFDGVVDFDKALRDPRHPSRLVARFASTDHLHPNDAGYQAMADAVDLSLFN